MAEKVSADKVVSFSYTLRDNEGNTLEKTEGGEPMQYLHGYQNIIPGLESEMEGMDVGDTKKVTVKPAEGYGEFDQNLVFKVPRANFPQGIEITPGMEFQTQTEQGPLVIRVEEITDEHVMVNANHPMAGQTLHFDIKIEGVRDATSQEKTHGHVHHGGHDH
jgi:FKBP-type peptidyl-prolyl cis-trans isomerase SlyD